MGHQAHQMRLLRWAPDVTGEKILITNAASWDRTRTASVTGQASTASLYYRVAIKAGYKSHYYHSPLHFVLVLAARHFMKIILSI